jgi:putative phage-type endonuclease
MRGKNADFKDLELILCDLIENTDINNNTYYDEEESALLNSIVLHIFTQYNTLNESLIENVIDHINDLILQHIKVVPPVYSDSQLAYLKDKLDYLEKIPQPEQRTPEWYEFRNNRLTASDLYHITSQSKGKIIDIVKKKCGVEKNYTPGAAILHGVKFEDVAIDIYEKREKVKITEFGCLPHSNIPFFGASPDGICSFASENKNYTGRMLEIKCPKSRNITGIIPPVYFAQVQGQLEVCDLEYCDFLECQIREYNSKQEFFEDTHETNYKLRKNGMEKGIVLEVYDTELKKTKYYYNYDKFRNEEDLNSWEEKFIDEILSDSKLEYNKTTFWRLEKYNIVLVKRNREWFTNNYLKIAMFWNQVLEARVNNTYAEDILNCKKKTVSFYPKKNDKNDEFQFLD